jgi:hypothetical protein
MLVGISLAGRCAALPCTALTTPVSSIHLDRITLQQTVQHNTCNWESTQQNDTGASLLTALLLTVSICPLLLLSPRRGRAERM